jgi:adenosylhomocysteine nucleosidase
MRILVTFAVDAEFAPWRKSRRFEKRSRGTQGSYFAAIPGAEIIVVLTGIGCKSDWLKSVHGMGASSFDISISSGLAGALRVEHKVGEVLVARSISIADTDGSVSCDPELVAAAAASGAKVVEHFYTANEVVLRAEEKRELGRRADAVEMESGFILRSAVALGARAVAVRGISDEVDENLPLDFNRVTTESGAVSIPRVLGQVVQHPAAVPSLIRFGQRSRLAAEKLAEFLDRYVTRLATPENHPLVGNRGAPSFPEGASKV